MADLTDSDARRVRVELGGGVVVTVADSDAAVPVVLLQMPAGRAHVLAHVLDDWSQAFGLVPDEDQVPSDSALARGLEMVTAAVHEIGALRCAARASGVVGRDTRVAAVTVLRDREEGLSAVQRIAVVDAAARWMEEDPGNELAHALLASVCSTAVITNEVYLALLLPAGDEE